MNELLKHYIYNKQEWYTSIEQWYKILHATISQLQHYNLIFL